MSWTTWASGVFNGIVAPENSVNLDTLWAWSNAESGADVMRWNNPLNTTQPWPGAIDMNSAGVKKYLTENDGMAATVTTLLNGFYPTIIANFRVSLPRGQWQNACPELGVWGTGCGWLFVDYGDAPHSLEGEEPMLIVNTPTDGQWLLWGSLYVHISTPADVGALQTAGAKGPMTVTEGFHLALVAATQEGSAVAFPKGFSGTFS